MQAATTQPMLRQVLTPKSENRFIGCAIDPIIQPTRPATRDQDAIVPGMVFLSAEGAQNQLQSLWATVNSSMRSAQGAWIPQVTPPNTQYLMAMPRKRFACRLSSDFQMNLVTENKEIIYQVHPDGHRLQDARGA